MSGTTENGEISAPESRLAFLIYRAGAAVSRLIEHRLRPLGLTPGELGLMTHLTVHGPGHVRAVARDLGVSPQTVVNMTRSLEGRGLLLRNNSPSDSRVLLVSLTPEGLALLAKADAVARHIDSQVLGLAAESDLLLAEVLRRVVSLAPDMP